MRRSVPQVVLGLSLAVLLAVLLAGCSGPATHSASSSTSSHSSPATSSTVAAVPTTTIRSKTPVVSHWPPGIAAVVVASGAGFEVIDANGVVFSENGRVPTYGTSDSAATWPTSLAVSPNGTYVAYRVAGGDLVVRLVATGETVAHMPIGSKDQVQAVSDDGALVALVASDMRPGVLYAFPPPRETVAIANLALHQRTVPLPIERVLTDRPHGDETLAGLAWRPNGDLLVSVNGQAPNPEVYRYDPAADSLTPLPALGGVIMVSTEDQVLTYAKELTRFADPSGGYSDVALPVVWTGGTGTEPILPAFASPGAEAAISADGSTVVMTVRNGPSGARGWQAFAEKDGAWRPASRPWPYPQGVELGLPQALSYDGSTAWGIAMQGTYSYVMSLDIATGEWEPWFTGADKLAGIWDIVPAATSQE